MKPTLRAKGILSGRILTEHDVLDLLSDRAFGPGKSQVETANSIGYSVQYLGDVLHGRRPVSEEMARRIGLRRVVMFVEDRSCE